MEKNFILFFIASVEMIPINIPLEIDYLWMLFKSPYVQNICIISSILQKNDKHLDMVKLFELIA